MTFFKFNFNKKDAAIKIVDNVHFMRRCQIYSRIISSADQYYIETNNVYIMYHSIAQCIVIIISGLVQTFFVKKLFQTPATNKPRA